MSKHKEMLEAIESSRGGRIFESIENLKTTYYIVERNHKQLWEFLGLCNKQEFVDQLNPMKGRKELNAYIYELSRLLHNFAAATKTLIDHTRNHVKDLYKELPFYQEYQAKLKEEISEVPVRCFIQDLRNYTLHKTLPVMNLACSIKHGVFEAKIMLDTDMLLKWGEWNDKSIEYIKTYDKSMPIDKATREYLVLIKNFYDWFAGRESDINRPHIDETNRMLAEYHALFHTGPRPKGTC